MAKRKRVALIYAYNENWIGGTYYIENLIAALGQLPDSEQPELLVFSWESADVERLQQSVQYAHWSFRRFERTLSLPERVLNKVSTLLFGKQLISLLYSDVDLVFPLPAMWKDYFSRVPHHLYWIPDFQEHYLPYFFKQEEIDSRKSEQELLLQVARHIVFSSYAAQQDFNSIYPNNKVNQYVLQFAVTSRPAPERAEACLARYEIDKPYFICSNQLWKHKNHITVIRALAQLLLTHPDALVVFTGKEHDYRNPRYFDELKELCREVGIKHEIKFLGFIAREDQLTLMQRAVAVVQPSLFEGWSTVIEDAKSMNVPLIASDIAVHKEQLADYEMQMFFSPQDETALAHGMRCALDGQLPVRAYPYHEDVVRFAQEFMSIVQRITKEA